MSDHRAPAPRFSRRHLLQLMGTSTALGLFSSGKVGGALVAAAWQPSGASAKATFAKGAIIRTLLKDIPPEQLASRATLFHEHFSIDLPPVNPPRPDAPPPPPPTKDVDLMIQEARLAAIDGVGCIVDGGHPDMGRDLNLLKKITTDSGLPIVASGGYYMERCTRRCSPRKARIRSPTSSRAKRRPIATARSGKSARVLMRR
jgi:hypothetical protein